MRDIMCRGPGYFTGSNNSTPKSERVKSLSGMTMSGERLDGRDRVGFSKSSAKDKSKIKEPTKKPAANSLSKQQIDKLFQMFCFNRLCREINPTTHWCENCSGCLLREIPWARMGGQVKDLCFAIWYESVLNS